MSTRFVEPAQRRQTRPPPWRDVRVLRVVIQVAFVIGVILLLRFFYTNLVTNLRAVGLPTGFGFLDNPTGFDIRDAPGFRRSQPIRAALLAGFINTVRTAAVGIILASALGLLIGIARLSSNWLVRKSAAVYVEALRNTPVVLIIVFLYQAVMLQLPPIAQPAELYGAVVLSNRGVWFPWGQGQEGAQAFVTIMAFALAGAIAVGIWRTRRFDATGEPHRRMLWGIGVVLSVGVITYIVLAGPVVIDLPERDGRVVGGGMGLNVTFGALLLGLALYTASHIAEIVRGSIQSVAKGQTEAAYAIALSGFQRMRYVVLPQALRVMIPPLASQYLNLTKNSSLAIFVGYVEVTRVTFTSIGNGNPAPQHVLILMSAYLFLSLCISLVANVVNRSLQLETR